MEEDKNIKGYLSSMNKIIESGNPKYLSYVCKEYMKYKINNPVLAMVLENMIIKESLDKGSVYAVLVDNDNTINLEIANDISKITNLAEFIKNVDALSEQNVDFGELTSDELIIEGMDIAEELAREIEEVETNIDYEDNTSQNNIESEIISKTQDIEAKIDNKENAIGKITTLGVMTSTLKSIFVKIKQKINHIKIKAKEKAKNKMNQNKIDDEDVIVENKDNNSGNLEKNKEFIQKVSIDERKVIKEMNSGNSSKKNKISEKGMSNTGTDDFDNFDDTSDEEDDNNGAPEDDEPDI